eukprot:CAMPEP_0177615510 /NCGR_PEP_ID=MMETSP0419_2-20121207/23490_1 /TAXON_ID=582737 /ORGANISM="Tetraselmis sp., Strain GSL018" /LENGTH=1504 /DNA_ID=CAMNT_0019113165 /DNA_START=266 /DNA_END=4780 /DNA_ORIENTATION=+
MHVERVFDHVEARQWETEPKVKEESETERKNLTSSLLRAETAESERGQPAGSTATASYRPGTAPVTGNEGLRAVSKDLSGVPLGQNVPGMFNDTASFNATACRANEDFVRSDPTQDLEMLSAALLPRAQFSMPRSNSSGLSGDEGSPNGRVRKSTDNGERAVHFKSVASSAGSSTAAIGAGAGAAETGDADRAEDDFPGEAEALSRPQLEGSASAVNIRVQFSASGREEYADAASGSSLWQGNRSSIAEVPASMRDCKFLQTRASDAHSSNPEYISVAAHEEVEAFVLLHCLAPVAGWLRDKFEEEKHTKVHMKWSLGFGYSLAAYANLSYKRHRDAHMKVWRLKKGSLLPGETLVLGGLGHSSLLSPSFNYVLCWKPVLDSTLSSTSRRVKINYKSKQALNEALEEAVVRQDVTKAEMLLKKGADAQITLSTASFRGCLLTKVPAMTHNMPMLCCLVEHGAELDWYSLMYVLQFSHVLPAAHAPVSDFLTRYVRAGRNPANTCYAIALGLANVAKEHTSKASEYSVLSEKFRQTTINLIEDLNKLSYIGGKERWMLRPDEVLEPTKCFSEHFPINLSSCSSTALKLHDTDYSSTSTVQNFLKRAWVGVHFIQVARATGDAPMEETSVCSNMYLLSIMSQYGFIGSLGRRFVQPASFIAHVVLFAGRPFFDSPRGRWCFKCLMHAAFLLVFHVALFEPKGRERLQATGARDMPLASRPGVAAWLPDETNARLSSDGFMHVVFSLMACWVAGMGVDLLNTCAYQYGGSLRRFLTVESLTNKLDITQFVVLSACLVNWGVVELSARGDLDVGQESSLRALKIVFSLSAIVVWVQTMFILRPINRGLAPLLYVIQQMMSEVLVFLVPLCALLLGFAAAILSLFWGSINEELGWTSMWDVILLLFRFFVSDFQMSFDIFDPGRYDNTFEPDPVLRLYAIFILILYTIVASILMANLLIAIITYKYDPEKIDAESNFQRVMMLEDYQTQVENRLLPAPFSLLVAALQLLSAPGGVCPKLPQRAFARLLLPPLDDLCDLPRRPTGARELPHLVYLLVMAPFVNALLLGALALCLPYCVLMFGSRASNHLAKMAARAVARPAGFAPVSRLRTLLTRKHVPRREALAKVLQAVAYAAGFLASWPVACAAGAVLYAVFAACRGVGGGGVLLGVLVRARAVWDADAAKDRRVAPAGGSGLASGMSDETSAKARAAGNTSNTSKRWGKLLAKQRKEEFKKIAFKPEEVDAALACAGLSIPKPRGEPRAEPEGEHTAAFPGSSDRVRLNASLKAEKERFSASIADGRARMQDHLGTSAGRRPPERGLRYARSLAPKFQRAETRGAGVALHAHGASRGAGAALHAHGAGPAHHAGPSLMEIGGLMEEMGAVRDEMGEIRASIDTLAAEMVRLQRQLVRSTSLMSVPESAGTADWSDDGEWAPHHRAEQAGGEADGESGFDLGGSQGTSQGALSGSEWGSQPRMGLLDTLDRQINFAGPRPPVLMDGDTDSPSQTPAL